MAASRMLSKLRQGESEEQPSTTQRHSEPSTIKAPAKVLPQSDPQHVPLISAVDLRCVCSPFRRSIGSTL